MVVVVGQGPGPAQAQTKPEPRPTLGCAATGNQSRCAANHSLSCQMGYGELADPVGPDDVVPDAPCRSESHGVVGEVDVGGGGYLDWPDSTDDCAAVDDEAGIQIVQLDADSTLDSGYLLRFLGDVIVGPGPAKMTLRRQS